MKRFILFSFLIINLFACKEDNDTSEIISIEDQEWYKELKTPCDENSICKTHIEKALYNNDTVYYTTLHGVLCDFAFRATLLSINGEVVKEYSSDNMTSFREEVTFIETIYKCDEN